MFCDISREYELKTSTGNELSNYDWLTSQNYIDWSMCDRLLDTRSALTGPEDCQCFTLSKVKTLDLQVLLELVV